MLENVVTVCILEKNMNKEASIKLMDLCLCLPSVFSSASNPLVLKYCIFTVLGSLLVGLTPGFSDPDHGNKKQCDVCGKYYQNKAKLERHKLIHSGIKPFECEICKKRFNQKANLKSHMVTHVKDQLFS